jgi:outer membrane usher protein FimD/PapC
VASEVKFYAVTEKNQKEQETNLSKKATKFILSFSVQNHFTESKAADMYIVVTEPDGQILKFSVWESGSFDSRQDGKKDYTLKLHFAYEKGEAKQLLYSLNAESYKPGTYTMQIYHNGVRIGQTSAKLI